MHPLHVSVCAICMVVITTVACGKDTVPTAPSSTATTTEAATPTPTPTPSPTPTPTTRQPVFVVLFTHIEDNMPGGALTAASARTMYGGVRSALVDMGERTRRHSVPWSLQPDWKLLEAALLFEDAAAMASTGGVNVFRYLKSTLGTAIDPHSHEGGGYNYTDVAHLLDLLGVGGSTVIGGHIWDPALPQFQAWDRFRSPVGGRRYPTAIWRGDILMGSGTPNHVNDPIISGVWRPRDRSRYFEDDPAGNIAAVGAFKSDLAGISELVALSQSGTQPSNCLLTASYAIRPADFIVGGSASAVESNVLDPLSALRARGDIELTTFTDLISIWRQRFGARACTYDGQRFTF